jgi:hypothetical protein
MIAALTPRATAVTIIGFDDILIPVELSARSNSVSIEPKLVISRDYPYQYDAYFVAFCGTIGKYLASQGGE